MGPKPGGEIIEVTAAVLFENGRVLIARRRSDVPRAGMWEFPGGKIQPGETPERCLKREIQEELGLQIAVGEFFGESVYAYEDQTIRLLAFRVRIEGGQMCPNDHAELAWVETVALSRYRFCPADIPFVEKLQATI